MRHTQVTVPRSDQTVHMMTRLDVCRVLWDMRRKEGRNVRELKLYTTDNLRQLYTKTDSYPLQLRDGIVSRNQLVAVIRWRVFWARFGYGLLLVISLVSAICAYFAWRDPVPAPSPPALFNRLHVDLNQG